MEGGKRKVASARGAVPLVAQTTGAGEIYAAYIILRFCKPPIEIVTDYEGLLTGWERGPATCDSGEDAHGEAWRWF